MALRSRTYWQREKEHFSEKNDNHASEKLRRGHRWHIRDISDIFMLSLGYLFWTSDPKNVIFTSSLGYLFAERVVYKLVRGPHIGWMPLRSPSWSNTTSKDCYIIEWSYFRIDTMISSMTLQRADVAVLGYQCRPTDTPLLQNEMHAILTTYGATLDATDIGSSLMCNSKAIGIIVGGRDRTGNLVTVLTLPPYRSFISYITAGGKAVIRNEEFHHAVYISNCTHFRCGGFIVHNRYVVTAAHCIHGVETANLLVAFTNLIPEPNPFFEWSSVESVETHPFYQFSSNENDIAVLKLKRGFPWNPLNRLMDLPDLSQISGDTPCEILRWIYQLSGNIPSRILMKSFGIILDSEMSEALGFHLRDEQFLTKSVYGHVVATENDIGNPIIFENNIIGMVVAVTGYPDPVTCLKILPYEDFIRNVISRS